MKELSSSVMSLSNAYDLWLSVERSNTPGSLNRDRSPSDLLNHRRAIECFATGYSKGRLATSEIPLSALAETEYLLARYLAEGAAILATRKGSTPPSKKTLSNLGSCLKGLRNVAFGSKAVAEPTSNTRRRLAELPKRRTRVRFPKALWPEPFGAEWLEYKAWKTKPFLTGAEGNAYRRSRCRSNTIEKGHVSNINPYVGYLVRERGMTSFGLAEACEPGLFSDFTNWYLDQDADGGYVFLKHAAAVMATLSQYLVATDQLAENTGGKKPWDVFYDMGREVMKLGAERNEIAAAPDVGHWTPNELRQLGKEGWTFEPVHGRMTSPYVHANAIFNRKRSALFFFLASETPLRARNWREMKWGVNLVRTPGGRWRVRFSGDELKIARRGYLTNIYEHTYSLAASRRIDDWRVVLRDRFGPEFEKRAPNVLPPHNPDDRRSGFQLSYGAFSQGINSQLHKERCYAKLTDGLFRRSSQAHRSWSARAGAKHW